MNFKKYIKEEINKTGIKKLVVLTSKPEGEKELYKTAEKLVKESKKMKLKTYIVYNEFAWITRDDNGNYFIHNKSDKKGFLIDTSDTLMIVRGSSSKFKSTLDIISQLEKAGFFIINSRETIEICSDKFRTILRLSESNIISPKSRIVRDIESINEIVDDFEKKFPLILKTITGSKGIGVLMVNNISDMNSILQLVWKIDPETEILVQEYIKSDRDYRIHVLGNEVIAGMERIRKTEDFRTNYSLGNDVKNIPIEKITDEMKEIAIKSAKAVNAIWCGVDIIVNKKGKLFVIEVNSSPGTTGIEQNNNLNICKTVLEYALDKDNWIIKPLEIGFKEYIDIIGIGQIKAKFDTGNGSLSVVHADKWKVKEGTVYWKNNNKNYKHKLIKMKNVNVGGIRNYNEERPVIKLDIKFNGIIYKDILVCLDDRNGRTPVLINRVFINKINAVINPNKKYTILVQD